MLTARVLLALLFTFGLAAVGAWSLIYGLCCAASTADERANAWRYSSSDDRVTGEP